MSSGKNTKRSVTYQFDLATSKMLIPIARYKGYSKLYQLNLSKMLLKCPQSPFARRDQQINNPEQLVIVSPIKTIIKKTQNQSESTLSQIKFDKLRNNIKNTLFKQDQNASNTHKKQFHPIIQHNSQSSPSVIDLPVNEKHLNRTLQKFNKNQVFKINKKKMYQSSVVGSDLKLCSKDTVQQIQRQSFIYPKGIKSQQIQPILTIQERKIEPKKKLSLNNHSHILNRSKNSKNMLPEIKPTSLKNDRNLKYNLTSKSNIPILYRDPDQLKSIRAEAYSILEYPTGNLILSNKGMSQYEIASLTKIMTFYTTMKIVRRYKINPQVEKVKINDTAMQMSGTSAEIIAGQIYTVQQLLHGMMLPSGNDAATALAEWGGKYLIKAHTNTSSNINSGQLLQDLDLKQMIKKFVIEMNINAKQLGLASTRFANQHGLPNSQSKSTSTDVAKLCFQCLKDDYFRKIVSTQNFKCTTSNSGSIANRSVEWNNTNKLLRRQGFIGIKTGITITAGPCLASAYEFRDKIYICVLLRASKVSRRFKQTRKLLAFCIEKLYENLLTAEQFKQISSLKRNKPEADSDYSQDQQQFNYQQASKAQFKKRSNIINYEM